MPRTDILCLGLWVDDTTASKHGVFFSRKESPENLSFMLQKPEKEKLNTLASTHYYLMDSGIWLLNARATMSLMEKSGWDDSRGGFVNGIPNCLIRATSAPKPCEKWQIIIPEVYFTI